MALEPLYDAMCIGAHPDDVEIGMGASVAGMTRRGKRVVIPGLGNKVMKEIVRFSPRPLVTSVARRMQQKRGRAR